jgi:steroid delta-isomerase-like uncharacterized protein
MSVTQTSDKNKEIVRRIYEECLNSGQLELLNQLVDQNFVGINGQQGPSAFASIIQELRQGFPDIRWTIEDLIAEGDRVVVRWRWQGTHRGSFRGIPASQKQMTNSAIAIYQLRDNKVVQTWIQTDQLGFLQQIGVISPDVVPQPQRTN